MKQYTGRTLDEVLNSIASEQGCQVQDITYNVLEEEKGGIFGLHKSITMKLSLRKMSRNLSLIISVPTSLN